MDELNFVRNVRTLNNDEYFATVFEGEFVRQDDSTSPSPEIESNFFFLLVYKSLSVVNKQYQFTCVLSWANIKLADNKKQSNP